MNDRTRVLTEYVKLTTKRKKFGYDYSIAVIEEDGFRAEFPVFDKMEALNEEILNVIDVCKRSGGTLSITFVYGEADRVSLVANDRISLNFMTKYSAFVPSGTVLKLYGLNRRDVNKAVRTAGKGFRAIFDTVRFTHGGVRIDAADKMCQKMILKVRGSNKSNKNKKFSK